MLKSRNYVCSRGLLESCDIHSLTPVSSIYYMYNYPSEVQPSEPFSIYVCTTALQHFCDYYLPNISQSFVLVSGDCDVTVPNDLTADSFETIISSPYLIRWYSQNCVISDNSKIVQMPIGLDYHTMSERTTHWGEKISPDNQEKMLIELQHSSQPTQLRQLKAYCNFQFTIHSSKYGYDRTDAIRCFPGDLTYYEPHHVGREDSWNTQTKYAFVISPHGNGLDCHRTWEALCLGCIPIVKTSPLDPMYDGLPVLILREWSECNVELLRTKLNVLAPLFDSSVFKEKISLKYWTERIQRDVQSVSHKNPEKMINSLPTTWDNNDKQNYKAHVARGLGQICGDEFSRDIESLARDSNNKTFLEIGTWNGLGSTAAFSRGFQQRQNANDYLFYSLECNAEKCADAQRIHAGSPNIFILNEVVWNEEPDDFYTIFPQCKTNAMYKHWNEVDLANMKKCPVFLHRPELPDVFDVLLLDGGEFTTYFEFQLLKNRCRTLLLDDTNVDKCKLIVEEIKANPDKWDIVKQVNVRNGYMIVKNRCM